MGPRTDTAGTTAAVRQLALVTGSAGGLGRALCDELCDGGFTVLRLARRADHAQGVAIDLSDPVASAATLARCLAPFDLAALEQFLFVSNAATIEPLGPVEQSPVDALARSLHVNLVSPVALIATALQMLASSPARKVLVNVTSGSALSARAGVALYSAAKAGMEHFVRCLAAEQAHAVSPFVVVNADPGAMDTAMQATLRGAEPHAFPDAAHFAARHARGELADPQAVAAAIVRLALSDTLVSGTRRHVRDPL
ncbi:SDR family NAD(P)-dependent oxidoreductase [Rhizobacter fulvus]|jgi:benzil reductase ((S)-benzoin forming)